MAHSYDYSGNTRIDMVVYCMAAITYITTEIAAIEGILRFIAVCISIVGFSFTALNQGTKYFAERKIRKEEKQNAKTNIRKNRRNIK